jgi:hypothetical protein
MARPAQRISKRAAHKAAVESRKDQPFVKLRKQRRNPMPFPSDFFAMAAESEREGVLLTLVCKKPRTFRAETTDDKGNSVIVALQKAAPPSRGYTVMLPDGNGVMFPTRRKALKYIADLEVTEVEAAPIKDGLGNPIRPGGTMANATDEQLGYTEEQYIEDEVPERE